MSGTCVVGLQWGDEAKGKLVDLLTGNFDIVARYQGGANAGHTVVAGENVYKLHLIPSGILNPNVVNVITAGVVLSPSTLISELDGLISRGVDVSGLKLSDRAHVVCPWHILEDKLIESQTSNTENIGTTLRGIGPCYRDKVGRKQAIRLGDLLRDDLANHVEEIVTAKRRYLTSFNGNSQWELNTDDIVAEFKTYAERLRPFVVDSTAMLLDALDAGKQILFEGAQGALLDVDHGTYPYVTSSNSSGVGVCAGAGVPPRWIKTVLGVAKCYSTRVGGGPFPTELDNETGEHIRQEGNEFGTTTGRPRRCGWFDAVAVRYTSRLSGVDGLAMMMLDVLSKLSEIKVCVAYDINGKRVEQFPAHVDDLRIAKPILETLPGWETDITGVRTYEDLPANAKAYLDRISELVGRPVEIVSVGPDRAQTIFLGNLVQPAVAAN